MSCFFLPDAYVAKWHVMFVCCLFLPDVSVAILAFVLYVLPNASEAIWHMLFRLMPLWLYGMCCFHLKPVWLYDMYCFFPPDACVTIWLMLFCHLLA